MQAVKLAVKQCITVLFRMCIINHVKVNKATWMLPIISYLFNNDETGKEIHYRPAFHSHRRHSITLLQIYILQTEQP